MLRALAPRQSITMDWAERQFKRKSSSVFVAMKSR
jgi:hypothetical protein